jgi:hypothetical protein
MFPRRFAFRRVRPAILPILAALLTGLSCSSPKDESRKPVHPVRGKVTVGDKPADGAFILFVPVLEKQGDPTPRPRATAGPDGTFTISTYEPNDGAPAGDYYVSIIWPNNGREDEDKLNGRYRDPKTSQLNALVREGPNDLKPFRLR